MAYQALYRQWRPDTFEDVIGQEPIVTTLKNQIKNGKISHAYLFSGTRGTGKTTMAKILARAVNCLAPVNASPCNECEVCQGILTERIMDVMEIDAASNNGVDHIRELRENVKYAPTKAAYKVYIIDEVHMLSGGAFNALLKTLEEPPAQVIFILATTEVHKLPVTILSRCQRFDFKPVRLEQIVARLKTICDDMNVSYEEEALRLIGQNGKGALRDAISLLEQCIGAGKNGLTLNGVMETLGITGEEMLTNLAGALQKKDGRQALLLLQQLIQEGQDSLLLIKDLIQHFRLLLLLKLGAADTSFFLTEERRMILNEQSKAFGEKELTRGLYHLSEAEAKAKFSTHPQMVLEMTLVTLCHPEADTTLEGLLARVEALEKALASGGHPSPVAPPVLSEKAPAADRQIAPQPQKSAEATAPAVSTQAPSGSTGDQAALEVVQKKWQEILTGLRERKKAQIKAMLIEGRPVGIKNNVLTIQFKEGFAFHRDELEKERNKEVLCQVIQAVTGYPVSLTLVMEQAASPSGEKGRSALDQLRQVIPEEMLEIIDE